MIAPDRGLPTPGRGVGFGLEGLVAPGLVSWALRHPEIDAVAERAGLGPVEDGSRERADGTTLRWRLTDPYAERMGGVVPFLIDWGDTPHPAASAPPGGRLLELRIEHPEPERVETVLAELGRAVEVASGAVPRLVAVVQVAEPSGSGNFGRVVELS